MNNRKEFHYKNEEPHGVHYYSITTVLYNNNNNNNNTMEYGS